MIKFGTDGWRAIISEEFTFENVRKVSKAIALYLLKSKIQSASGGPKSKQCTIIIGYDPRFLADKFAEEVVKVMEEAGINCLLTERDTPTPIVAWEVRDKKAAGAVMITASHNPAQYCGIKFIPDYAGPADEKITAELQENSNKEIVLPKAARKGIVERFEPRERYAKYILSFIDVDLIRKAKVKIAYDPMHGAARGYLDRIFQDLGCELEVIHGHRDVLFGGGNPEPEGFRLKELVSKVLEMKAEVGLANDGDADRFGVVDEQGQFLSANQMLPLVFNYLVSHKGYQGAVVRSVATSHFLDRIASQHKIKVYETPVGFKHIAKLMLQEDIIIGGEESGGLSIKGHIPEKDGLLANLLVVEMLAKFRKPLSEIWKDLINQFGEVYTERINLKLKEEDKVKFMDKLHSQTPHELAGLKVKKINKIDGVKLVLSEGSWILARPSGTEPLVRIYMESDKREKLEIIEQAVKKLL